MLLVARLDGMSTITTWLTHDGLPIVLTILAAIILQWILRRVVTLIFTPRVPKALRNLPLPITSDVEKRHQARLSTLASVLRSVVSITVWVWAILSILSILGLNVGPLIASAGIAGVALGIGAQSVVRDFLNGIFMLMENQYGVGDTVTIGTVTGTVEDMSMRLTTIRDAKGILWHIRNGEILQIGNASVDYAIATINTPVLRGTPTQQVLDVIKTSVTNAATKEDLAPNLLEDPVVDGVTSVDTDYIIVRTRAKTIPGKQWSAERIIGAAIADALAEAFPEHREYPKQP